ncbi:MAG: hypothetical protein ACXW1A_03250 [Nitrososphaeraceae archaeon]
MNISDDDKFSFHSSVSISNLLIRDHKDYPLKTPIMTLAVHHEDDAILYNRIRRKVRLLEMNLIISAALNKAIGKSKMNFQRK